MMMQLLSSVMSEHTATGTAYRFIFTSVRFAPRELQLQEVLLFSRSSPGNRLSISSASNPGGDSPLSRMSPKVIDGDTTTVSSKWLDQNMLTNGKSELLLSLVHDEDISGYTFVTANDVVARDPVSWQLFRRHSSDSTWILLDERHDVLAPVERFAMYEIYRIEGPPPSPPSPPSERLGAPAPLSLSEAPPPPPPTGQIEGASPPPPPHQLLPPLSLPPSVVRVGQTIGSSGGQELEQRNTSATATKPVSLGQIAAVVVAPLAGLLVLLTCCQRRAVRDPTGPTMRAISIKLDNMALASSGDDVSSTKQLRRQLDAMSSALQEVSEEVRGLKGRTILIVDEGDEEASVADDLSQRRGHPRHRQPRSILGDVNDDACSLASGMTYESTKSGSQIARMERLKNIVAALSVPQPQERLDRFLAPRAPSAYPNIMVESNLETADDAGDSDTRDADDEDILRT